jgi:hypothetical protein
VDSTTSPSSLTLFVKPRDTDILCQSPNFSGDVFDHAEAGFSLELSSIEEKSNANTVPGVVSYQTISSIDIRIVDNLLHMRMPFWPLHELCCATV